MTLREVKGCWVPWFGHVLKFKDKITAFGVKEILKEKCSLYQMKQVVRDKITDALKVVIDQNFHSSEL